MKGDYPLALWMSIAGGRIGLRQDRSGPRFGTPQKVPNFYVEILFSG